MKKNDPNAFIESMAALAFGGKLVGSDKHLMVVSADSADRLQAIAGFLIKEGFRLTEGGKFAEFALVHGTHGPALPCDWMYFEQTDDGGEITFIKRHQYVENLEDCASEGTMPWIDHVGHGFMLATEPDYNAWLDFSTGRTIINLKS